MCGRVCLPAFLWREFIRAKGGDEAEAEPYVQAWARTVLDEWTTGTQADTPIGEDPIRFWRSRWEGTHGKTGGLCVAF